MILLDFNGVVVGQILSQKEFNEDMLRHQVLNTIRMYNQKFKKEYGNMIIAMEGKSWRRDIFPQYKAKRRVTRDDNAEKYQKMFEFLNKMKEELRENFPYQIVQVDNAEADDIIAVAAHETQQFGQYVPIMIVSADKDFVQLQKYSNVKQFSPMSKKLVVEKDIERNMFEHFLKGDSSDGIPNIYSSDDTFVEGIRQKPMTKKKIDELWKNREDIESSLTIDQYRNYCRNKKLISLFEIPDDVTDNIKKELYSPQKPIGKSKTLNYLIQNRCRLLVECVDEFYS